MSTIPQRLREIASDVQRHGFVGWADRIIAIAAELEAPAADAVMSDESIMNLWDTRVGDPSAKYPLTRADILCFARAIAGPLQARINALEARQAELQRISEAITK